MEWTTVLGNQCEASMSLTFPVLSWAALRQAFGFPALCPTDVRDVGRNDRLCRREVEDCHRTLDASRSLPHRLRCRPYEPPLVSSERIFRQRLRVRGPGCVGLGLPRG